MSKILTPVMCLMCLCLFILAATFAANTAAASESPDVAALVPFTAEANYMSLPGYLRLGVFTQDGAWITRLAAVKDVKAQGANPTLSCADAKRLNGCKK